MTNNIRSGCVRYSIRRNCLLRIVSSSILLTSSAAAFADEPFKPLFNGVNFDGWYTFDDTYGKNNDVENYYKIENGELVILDIPETNDNKAFGYLSTVDDYADYHLRFEYQWGEKKYAPRQNKLRDSGLLYHFVGGDKIWPSSLESQVQEGDTGDFIGIAGTRMTSSVDGGDYSATGSIESNLRGLRASTVADTLDGWNVSEVVVRGDSAVHIVNGQVVNRLWDATISGDSLTAGRIAFQAEGATIRYRNIEIRNLKSSAPRVLLFSETRGFRHSSIPTAVESLEELVSSAGFDVDIAGDSDGVFTDANLAGYDAVVWVMTTGNVLDNKEQAAFEHYIRSGGGYAGIHSASDTEYDWPWYGNLVGAWFDSHPSVQSALQNVEIQNHISTEHLGSTWTRTDEWYDFQSNPRSKVNVLLALDEDSYSGGGMGNDHPIAWYHEFDGGRSWYTGGGHTVSSYEENDFRAHLLGGILYAAGISDTSNIPTQPPEQPETPEPEPTQPPETPEPEPTEPPETPTGPMLDRSDWVVSASHSRSGQGPSSAIDASIDTRWSTGKKQAPGMYFQVDLGSVADVTAIVLDAGVEGGDYPRGYDVLVSSDGVNFSGPVSSGSTSGRTTVIEFAQVTARYLRIVQTGSDGNRWWSIHEINIVGSESESTPPSAPPGGGSALDRSTWSISSSSTESGGGAIDNDPNSRWSTGTKQVPGQWFMIDLGVVSTFDQLVLSTSAAQPFDYPRGYKVYVSDDGVNFGSPVASGVGSATTEISLGNTAARYVRIEQTGSDSYRYWSIYDAMLYNNQ